MFRDILYLSGYKNRRLKLKIYVDSCWQVHGKKKREHFKTKNVQLEYTLNFCPHWINYGIFLNNIYKPQTIQTAFLLLASTLQHDFVEILINGYYPLEIYIKSPSLVFIF